MWDFFNRRMTRTMIFIKHHAIFLTRSKKYEWYYDENWGKSWSTPKFSMKNHKRGSFDEGTTYHMKDITKKAVFIKNFQLNKRFLLSGSLRQHVSKFLDTVVNIVSSTTLNWNIYFQSSFSFCCKYFIIRATLDTASYSNF